MKNIKFTYIKMTFILGCIFTLVLSCERELSDEAIFATFSNTAEVFSDSPVGLGSNFYFPFQGSKATAWTVDDNESYQGKTSMRFDIPNANDLDGNYAGAIFRVDGAGRNLTGYDALTFWAKATQGVSIDEMGFGQDFGENKYQVVRTNISLSTNWVKYIIPIPDASKLINERGMFWYSAGTQATGGLGYTFWIDELKFEKLGTLAQPKPTIFGGIDGVSQSVVNGTSQVSGLTQTFNSGNGRNITVSAAPSYFDFESSNTNVAIVDEFGIISLISDGVSKITATIGGVAAAGSLTLSATSLNPAPTPTQPAANVISLFSNAYNNIAGVVVNANYGGQTTQSSQLNISGDDVISYTNLNYVGFEFQNPTVNATGFNFIHVDVYTNSVTTNAFNIEIRDRGANGAINTNVFTGAPSEDDKRLVFSIPSNQITQGEWMSFDIPLTGDLATQKANLAAIIFSGNIDFLLDNVYLYK